MFDTSSNPSAETEQIVLLNEDWQPIGQAPKLASHNANTPLHLAFSCYIFDAQGRVLVTQRALPKKVWPGIWTNSCCGHPAPGEVMEDAISRRVQYELGMTITDLQLILPRFRYRCELDGIVENECCPVYIAKAASPVLPNPLEVETYTWMTWAEFNHSAHNRPEEFSEWCRLQLPLLALADVGKLGT